jgi:glycosyltransferase involved in cell wall biosynthesis
MKVSIIIPCYNEVKTIKEIVSKVEKYKDFETEIIVVDDGSTDGTLQILNNDLKNRISCLLINKKNFGKGYSVRRGIDVAKGDIIIIQDSDLEYDPSDYPRLIDPISKNYADVVYGSRFIGSDQKRVLHYWHSLGNAWLTTLSNIFTDLNLTDMEVGYKAFRSSVIKDIQLKENRFGFEPEITAKIAKKKVRIFEVGIKYYGRTYSEGKKIGWKDAISAIRCIIFYNIFKK